MGSNAWEARSKLKPVSVHAGLDLGGEESPLDLLNLLAASQSRQVRLPEPFLTPIPGCAHSRTPWGARGRGSLLLGAEALGMEPWPAPQEADWQTDLPGMGFGPL